MELVTYQIEAQIAETHWWFVARRRFFSRILRRLKVPKDARILDVGSSTGTNLILLKNDGYLNVSGLDSSPTAVQICAEKGLPPVVLGDATELPFADTSTDFIFATDILEHLDEDQRALSEIFRVLMPGGYALISVPTFQSLWGLQDDRSHHRRRYRLGQIRRLVKDTGFIVSESYYFNFLLFLPIFLARFLYHVGLFRSVQNENQVNNPLLNWIFKGIFIFDTVLAPYLHVPFGVSALVLAQRRPAS